MKKTIYLSILLVLLPLSVFAQGKNNAEKLQPFYFTENAPHIENVLPNPPGLSDPLFFNDLSQYEWGKQQRSTERGELAVKDASINAKYFMERFSPVMSHTVTPEANPVLFKLLSRAHLTEQQAGRSAKSYFHRVRPYQQFKEPTAVPSHENPNDLTSYPSGHTHASWLVGMILTSIDPSNTEGIMKVAYELGQSRVIVGYHYQSDVDAGRVAGSITFARLCAMPEFIEMLQAAAAEFSSVQEF